MGIGDSCWCSSRSRTIRLGQSHEEIGSVSSQPSPGSNKHRWKVLLKKLKRKLFESSSSGPFQQQHQVPYDEHSYWQNFDQGSWKDEPDNLSRSFSVRFADPCRDLRKKAEVFCQFDSKGEQV
ncbi:hypothetical protein GH714_039250 [Hevea brasiliensis]|uniref:Uncharacterized protein n=1 Tax=Hevea brasiliensis TaxID=3981 RepID=A0A6A6LYV5_HEVBR|nr:hypothetical protein GH714_039250 [Hevea brasiliensis]